MSNSRTKITALEFKAIFDEYYQWLCNYVFQLSGDMDLSEDLVQEVFIDFWNKSAALEIYAIKNYLFKCCHNRFLGHIRKQKVSGHKLSLDEIKWEVIHDTYEESDAIKNDKLTILHKAIEGLSPKCKQAFMLSKFDNLKYKEIAAVMGISIKTVEVHLSKALSHIRNTVSLKLIGMMYLLQKAFPRDFYSLIDVFV